MNSNILSAHPPVNLNHGEVMLLKVATTFWLGLHQDDAPSFDVKVARHLARRLGAVATEMKDKAPNLTWRLENLDVRTLAVIREALKLNPSFQLLQEKFR